MPPGPAYNALAVLYSLAKILEHAAHHRATTGARALGVSETVLNNWNTTSPQGTSNAASSSVQPQTDNSAAERTSSRLDSKSSTTKRSPPQLSKAEKRRRQLQLEDEEFRAILGKRWVDGVLVDRALPSAPTEAFEHRQDVPEPPPASFPSESTQTTEREPLADGKLALGRETERVVHEVEEASHQIENEREAEMERENIPDVAMEHQKHLQQDSESTNPLRTTTLPLGNSLLQPIHTKETRPLQPTKASTQTLEESPVLTDSASTSQIPTPLPPKKVLQASKVPSSRIGRLFHYGGLAASLGYGAAAEMLRGNDTTNTTGNVMLSEANIKRLVGKLTQMRGAALKLGQFMSIQDTHLLPPELDQIFRRVQDSAHYMPDWQMEKVMSAAYGPNWFDPSNPAETIFTEFERVPFAAASIGQVHRARLAPRFTPPGLANANATQRGLDVAVKVQFPNIVNSIKSDLGYVKMLLSVGGLLPKGLFLDQTIEVMSAELADECSYTREASFLRQFASKEMLGGDERFKVPWVWDGSTDQVLVMERVGGVGVGDASSGGNDNVGVVDVGVLPEESEEKLQVGKGLSQRDRDDIAARIIELCLKELFEFRTMQTDPNWTNFLWNQKTRQVELVDFGATRTYGKQFMDSWLRLLQAAASDDRAKCIEESLKLGYLTGGEDEVMLDAHVNSLTLLATPFKASTAQPFSFGPHSIWANVTKEIRSYIPVMVSRRLTPPPKETYSLNRKLSGAFLLAARLDAKVDTKKIWDRVVGKYEFGGYEDDTADHTLLQDLD